MIEILNPGLQATVQDLGRTGFGHLGVPRAGAADPISLRLANALVGNAGGDAAVEFLLGGFSIRFGRSATFALSGAPVDARLGSTPVQHDSWVYARSGQVLTAGSPPFGLRTYLAVAGGVTVPPLLGSRSTCTLSGLGPPRLRAGDSLPTGTCAGPGVPVDAPRDVCRPRSWLDLHFRWGPRDDWFPREAKHALISDVWRVDDQSDRIGARLAGPELSSIRGDHLPSEGMHLGSIQVPGDGRPIVLLANHAPTGGYPVIGVVGFVDVCRLAQTPPGSAVRFVPA